MLVDASFIGQMVGRVQRTDNPAVAAITTGRYEYTHAIPFTNLNTICAEPNNASPLNPDAAAIWDSPDRTSTAFYTLSFLEVADSGPM